MAYGLVSIPAAFVLEKVGYARTILISLGAMILGCLLMPIATHADAYGFVLVALFVIAAGITQLQVAANPLAAQLGSPERSHFRLTLSQTFNSLGTVIAPYLGSYLILRGGVFAGASNAVSRAATLRNVDTQFLLIAGIIVLLALFIWWLRGLLHVPSEAEDRNASPFAAFASRWALFGGLAIFLYVGAEVSIGSIMINYLHQPAIMNVSFERAGRLLSFYWGGAMVGRALGSAVLIRVPASRLLAFNAAVAVLLCLFVTQASGSMAGYAAIAVGFFNSIMFPTIFALGVAGLGPMTSRGSGIISMAIIGGAGVPLLISWLADGASYQVGLIVAVICYLYIAWYGVSGSKPAKAEAV